MAITWATLTTLEASLGRPFEPGEQARAESLLARARVVILSRVPNIEDLVTAGTVLAEVPAMVQEDMVVRVLEDPRGVRTEAIEGVSYTRDSTVVGGRLKLTRDELTLLGQSSGFAILAPYYRTDSGEFGGP